MCCSFSFCELDHEVKTFFRGKRKKQVDFSPLRRISCLPSEGMFWNKSNKVSITEHVGIWIMSCLMIALTYAPNKTKPKKNLGYNFWNWGELDGEKKSSSDPEKAFSYFLSQVPAFVMRLNSLKPGVLLNRAFPIVAGLGVPTWEVQLEASERWEIQTSRAGERAKWCSLFPKHMVRR